MTHRQSELVVEILTLIAMLFIFIAVGMGIVKSFVLITGNLAIFAVALVAYKMLDKINRR